MTRTDHLLWILAEECMEVAQRVSKAARFGLQEIQPGQELTNDERILREIIDLFSVLEMLDDEKILKSDVGKEAIQAKKDKVEKFLKYSKECGTLTD